MNVYTVDQFGGIYKDGEGISVVDAEYQQWLNDGGVLERIFIPPSLDEYKAMVKQNLADKADAFIDRITQAAGIPKSEVANFEAKAQAAIAYKFNAVAIPVYSAINQESAVTGETIDDLCDKIIERFEQREWVNGQISGMRRRAGWAIDAATDESSVDAVFNETLLLARDVFSGYVV